MRYSDFKLDFNRFKLNRVSFLSELKCSIRTRWAVGFVAKGAATTYKFTYSCHTQILYKKLHFKTMTATVETYEYRTNTGHVKIEMYGTCLLIHTVTNNMNAKKLAMSDYSSYLSALTGNTEDLTFYKLYPPHAWCSYTFIPCLYILGT